MLLKIISYTFIFLILKNLIENMLNSKNKQSSPSNSQGPRPHTEAEIFDAEYTKVSEE